MSEPTPAVLLLLVCGLPGAGKTTLARTIGHNAAERLDAEVHHISFDALYDRVRAERDRGEASASSGGAQANAAHAEAWATSRLLARRFTEAILDQYERTCADSLTTGAESAQQHGRRQLLLLDDNFFYRSMRHEYYRLAQRRRIAFLQLHLTCELDAACRRVQQRRANDCAAAQRFDLTAENEALLQQLLATTNSLSASDTFDSSPIDSDRIAELQVTEATIRKMALVFEAPRTSEDAHDIGQPQYRWEPSHSLQVESTEGTPALESRVPWAALRDAFVSRVPPVLLDPAVEAARVAASRAATTASVHHTLDLETRRALTRRITDLQALTDLTPADKKTIVARWNQQRKQLLLDVKQPNSHAYQRLHSNDGSQAGLPSDSDATGPSSLRAVMEHFEASLT